MSNFKLRLLIYFATISASTLLISNLAAVKLWNFFGIAVDGGVVVFPITYIIGDLIVEFYGKKIAKNIILAGFFINILAIIVFYIVIALPPYEGWTMQAAMASVLGFTPRIIIGSLTAYVCSNFLNNYIFTRLKSETDFSLPALSRVRWALQPLRILLIVSYLRQLHLSASLLFRSFLHRQYSPMFWESALKLYSHR